MRKILAVACIAISPIAVGQDIYTGAGAQAGAGAQSGSAVYFNTSTHSRVEPADVGRVAPLLYIPSVQPTADCTKPINVGASIGGIFGSNAFAGGGGWVYEDDECRAMNAYLKATQTLNKDAPYAERFLKITQCQIPEYWMSWEIIARESNMPELKCPNEEPAGGVIAVRVRQKNDPGVAKIVPTPAQKEKQELIAQQANVFPVGSGYSH